MKDEDKTKEQLIGEFKSLYRRVAELELSEAECQRNRKELMELNLQLEEAVNQANRIAVEAQVSNVEFNRIFNTATDGMCLIDYDFNIVMINHMLLKLLKKNGDEVVNRKCHEVLGDYQLCHSPLCPLVLIREGKDRVEYEVEKTRSDGAKIPCLVTASSFRDTDGSILGMVASFKDMSLHKRAEEERIYREKLQAVLEIVGAVCHELHQPMQTILGYSDLILMDIQEDNPLYEDLQIVREQIVTMRELTKKLQKITRYETTGYAGKTKIIDIDKSSG
ncbi:MAG: PAS domain-containing protein [Deltaproteobacteria bacterium]|nr:PAS domain-containing protein [Deltaproteobacteria bacterium]